jgi:ParB-like chromosome segregation protein Spo0J
MQLPLSEPTLFPLESNATSTNIPQFELRAVKDLSPHPALIRMQMLPSPARLAELESLGARPFDEPIVITHEGFIVDGHARWIIARQLGRERLMCDVRVLSQGEALVRILDRDAQRPRFNSYCRVELAFLLESGLRKRAEASQSNPGQERYPSNLTRSKPIDCRPEIARLAKVSTGNVSKVRSIRERGIPRLVSELRAGMMTIHAGWKLAQMSRADQEIQLGRLRTRARRARRIGKLLARVEPVSRALADSLRQLWMTLRELKAYERLAKLVGQIDAFLLEVECELQTDEEDTETENQ